MKTKTLLALTILFLGSTAANQRASAAPCTSCNSNSCTECVVKVGVFGYTPPTWRPWPQTKFKSPTDREKIERRLIRPEPFETPPPRSEADGVPRKAQPEITPPPIEPMPDLPPDLPPQLRNKQPIPIHTSSVRKPQRTIAKTSTKPDEPVTSVAPARLPGHLPPARTLTPITTGPPSEHVADTPLQRVTATERTGGNIEKPAVKRPPARRRIASLNRPTSARRTGSQMGNDNPLRYVSSRASSPSVSKRAVANMPFVIQAKSEQSQTSNPLR